MVPKAGFEPAHPGGRQTLNLEKHDSLAFLSFP